MVRFEVRPVESSPPQWRIFDTTDKIMCGDLVVGHRSVATCATEEWAEKICELLNDDDRVLHMSGGILPVEKIVKRPGLPDIVVRK